MADAKVVEALYAAVEDVNRTRPPGGRVVASLETRLMGGEGGLDSLGLVNLIVAVEEHVEMAFGALINLGDQRALANRENPLQSLGTLAEYVEVRLREVGQL